MLSVPGSFVLEREPDSELADALLGLLDVAGVGDRLHEARDCTPAALARCEVIGSAGFLALNRLNTSAIASTRALPLRRNDLLRRRFSCENGARRLQLTFSHGPTSSKVAVPSSFSPV